MSYSNNLVKLGHAQEAERLLKEGVKVVQEIKDVEPGPRSEARRDALGKQAMGIWAQAQVHATLSIGYE